jgi:hypothetical protein
MTDALLAEAYGFLPRENATPFRAGQDE